MRERAFSRYVLPLLALFLGLIAPAESVRFVAFLVFFLLACAVVYDLLVAHRIRVRRLDPEIRGARQEGLPERVWVENPLPFPIPRLVAAEGAGRLYCDDPVREVTLPPSGGVEVVMTMRGERRGEYHYGPFRLRGTDPFGFFPWERGSREPARAVVYPRIYSISLVNRTGSVGGSIPASNPAYEDVTRFRSLREYVAGDDPKRVNWKASAKSGKLFTTEYERTLSVSVRLVLDLMADDYPLRRRDQLVERAVEVTAALVFLYSRLGQRVGLVAAGGFPDAERSDRRGDRASGEAEPIVYKELAGRSHIEGLLEVLARIAPRPGSADYTRLIYAAGRSLPADLRIILVAPVPRPAQVEQLRLIRASHLHVELFAIPTEEAGGEEALNGVLPVRPVTEAGDELIGR